MTKAKPVATAVSAARIAEHLGITRQYIGRLKNEGVLPAMSDGRFDQDQTRLRYIEHLRSRRSSTTHAADEFRRLKTREIALRVARYEGTLMETLDCFAIVDELIGLVRTIFGGLPAKASRDPAVRATISSEVSRCLNKLADIAAKKALEVRPDAQTGHA